MTHDEFGAEVARQFEFLEKEYGMRREPVHKDGRRGFVTYGNIDVKVIVEQEENTYCSVSVQNLRYIKHDALERSEFDLDEIVAASGAKGARRQDFRASREGLSRAAETLRTAGASVLRGDFAALHARQRATVEILRRYNPPIEGEPVNRK